MKKLVICCLVLFCACNSQKSLNSTNDSLSGIFIVNKSDDNFLYISKKRGELKSNKETEFENSYSMKIPKRPEKIKASINSIPNSVDFIYEANQLILIRKLEVDLSMNYSGLEKEDFLMKLRKLKATKYLNNFNLKAKRLFGVYASDDYLIMYLNIKSKKEHLYEESIKSLRLVD